ncbi:MAG: DUF364 domain-containing protein [Kiritimatiellae bacterium]|nr:DUF364 domain-containing protein [Kiritimatiellia bacterium]
MLQKNEIARRLHEYMSERMTGIKVSEVRIGVGYAAVALDKQCMGLAAVLRQEMESHCSVVTKAGKLSGMPASELLGYLTTSRNSVEMALGLATANAVLSTQAPQEESDTLALMNLSSKDHVAMVGLFRPLVPRIEQSGAKLTILEQNKVLPNVLSFKSRGNILKTCTVAVITATSILNNTLETILNDLENPRWVSILGPSTPVCRAIFAGTPVTHLGGSVVLDRPKVLQIISEGGGTPLLRPYLRFVNLVL